MPGLKLFINLATVALGLLISRRNRHLADCICCGLGIVCIALCLLLVASGLFHDSGLTKSLHNWTAHGTIIAFWSTGLFSLGVAFQQAKQRGFGVLALRVLAIVFAFVIGLLCAFTGYLGPSHDANLARDTHNRFIVAHMIVLPAVLVILLALWTRLFWPKRMNQSTSQSPELR